jgi:hypothetical protein
MLQELVFLPAGGNVRAAQVCASSAWSWPQFWIGGPVILTICVSGLVAVIAVMRARPEDVPQVLAIFGSALVQLAARLRIAAQISPWSGHHGKD